MNYNPNYLQVSREVTTFVTIDGKTGKVFEKRYVDSTPTPWSREKLQEESESYLSNKFPGEESKIRGSTYTIQTCRNTMCKYCIRFLLQQAPLDLKSYLRHYLGLPGSFLGLPVGFLINDFTY